MTRMTAAGQPGADCRGERRVYLRPIVITVIVPWTGLPLCHVDQPRQH
jgi:hypothetical protein